MPTPAQPNGSDGRQRSAVVLGPNDRVVGQLYIEGDLRVAGKVEGEVEATGDIEIAGGGTVSGTITAYNRLVVGGGASLTGDEVRVGRLTVEDGANFSGHVTMGKAAMKAPKPVVAEPSPIPQPQPEPQPELKPEPQPEIQAIEAAPVVVEESRPAKSVQQQKGKRR